METLLLNPMQPYIDAVRASTGVNGVICVSTMQHGGHPELGEWGHWSIHLDSCNVIGRTFDEALERIVSKLGHEVLNRQIDPIALGM